MPDEKITPDDWLQNVLSDSGKVERVRHMADVKGDAWKGNMNVRTVDGREFLVTIREVQE